jgi:cytidine deaminase
MPGKGKAAFDPEMLRLALGVRERAHAPYSGFRVGACIKGASGGYHTGCNVENASYPEGSCAETGAIAAMVADGKRRIAQVLVVADGERLCTPCGGCRQRLAEFADPDTPVTVYGPEGFRARFALRELLPHAFDLAGEASA